MAAPMTPLQRRSCAHLANPPSSSSSSESSYTRSGARRQYWLPHTISRFASRVVWWKGGCGPASGASLPACVERAGPGGAEMVGRLAALLAALAEHAAEELPAVQLSAKPPHATHQDLLPLEPLVGLVALQQACSKTGQSAASAPTPLPHSTTASTHTPRNACSRCPASNNSHLIQVQHIGVGALRIVPHLLLFNRIQVKPAGVQGRSASIERWSRRGEERRHGWIKLRIHPAQLVPNQPTTTSGSSSGSGSKSQVTNTQALPLKCISAPTRHIRGTCSHHPPCTAC